MPAFVTSLKQSLLWMFEPPWRHSGADDERLRHWIASLTGWMWMVAGMVLGAFVAPALVQFVGLANTQYEYPLVIGVALVVGFLVQLVTWSLVIGVDATATALYRAIVRRQPGPVFALFVWRSTLIFTGSAVMTVVTILFFDYFNWAGPRQSQVAAALLGQLLVRTLRSLVNSNVTRWGWKKFMDWLRGDTVHTSNP